MTYKRASFGLMIVLTSLLCFFAVLFSTPWGTQFTFFLLGTTTPLEVEYRSGALLNDLRLNQLTLNNNDIAVEVKDVHLQLHLLCLWKKQLCIDELSIGSLRINLKANSSTSSDELTKDIIVSEFFTWPFTVKVKKLSLVKVNIINQNLEINLIDFSSALSINRLAVTIEKSMLASAIINVSEKQLIAQPILLVQPPLSAQLKLPNQSVAQKSIKPWPLAQLPKVYFPFHLTFKSFAVSSLTVNDVTQKNNKARLKIENSLASFSWFKTTLRVENLLSKITKVEGLSLISNISTKGNIDFTSPYTIDLTLSNSITSNEILPLLNDSMQQVLLKGDLSRLAVTANNQGALVLTAEGTVDITNVNLPYELATEVTKFSLPNDITNIVTPYFFSFKSQGDINQQTIELSSEFSGLGYQNVAIELAASMYKNTLKVNTLFLQDNKADNMIDMTGELKLGSALSWNINVNSSGLTLPNIDKRLSGRVQGTINSSGFWRTNNSGVNAKANTSTGDSKWAISLVDSAIKGEINGVKLNLEANVDLNDKGELAPSKLMLNYGDLALNLKGYSDDEWHVDGVANLGNINSWVQNIESGVNTKVNISGSIQNPEINLQGEFLKVFSTELFSEAVDFEVKYHPMNNHKHQITLTSSQVNFKEYTMTNFNLSSQGDLNQQQIKLNWFGDSSIDLLADIHYSPVNDRITLQTQNASFSLGEHFFKSNKPIKLLYETKQNTLAINKHCWLEGDSQLCLNNDSVVSLTQGKLFFAAKINMELIKPFIPEEIILDTTIDGNIAMVWQQDRAPSIDAKLFINKGKIQLNKEGELRKLGEWKEGEINLQWLNNTAQGNMTLLSYLDSTEVNTKANNAVNPEILNAGATISFVDNRIAGSNIIDSYVTINNFDLSPLQAFLPELSLFEGLLSTKLTAEGALGKPKINGEITLVNGQANILGNINALEDIKLALSFNGQQAVISGDVNINKVAASLTGNLDWKNDLQGSFDFNGESINLAIPPELTITVSPEIKAQITASDVKLSGRVEVLKGKLSVNQLPEGSVSLSKDAIIVDDKGEQIAIEKSFDVFTNIRVVIAEAFKIEGQGFVGRLGGELQVSQQPRQPLQLFGSLKVPEGRYRAYGQDLSVSKGNISFNGPATNPYVSIQATRSIEKEDVVVGIDATGLANSLQVRLFSTPSMQQSETLSYLVRGRGLDAETSNSNAAIGVALGTAITNFSGVLTQLEKLPLINKLELDGSDDQASIAGYLGDKVYIKYGIGVTEPINELTVRFYFLSRLWIEAVSGLENSANIYYSFDIE
jgi:translocation and assembly module TamB